MWRAILGVILGYLAMAIFIFATFTGAYLAMGTEGAFQPGSYHVSTTWILASFVLGLVAAALGGWVCAMVARGGNAVKVLAGIVLVLGLVMAIPVLTAERDPASLVRDGSVGNVEAMQSAHQPGWVALLNPLVGAAGVLLGGRLRKERAA